jgi:nucleoporin NDC1
MLCSTPTQSSFHQPNFTSPTTFSSPPPPIPRATSTLALSQEPQQFSIERECWNVYRDRFKYVILSSIIVQYILLMIYSIILNIGFLNPLVWLKEIFSILFSPLILVIIVHIYFTLKPMLDEKIYYSSRFEKFVRGFKHGSLILTLEFFIGIFTSMLFLRYLSDDYKRLSVELDGKRFLNQNFAFLIFNGAFMRCYFYFNPSNSGNCISFPIINQSKMLRARRQIVVALKSSFKKTLIPLVHYIGFYAVFGSAFKYLLIKVFILNDASIYDHILNLINLRLLAIGWILSSLIWCNMDVMNNLIIIYTTEPKMFEVDGMNVLTLVDALETKKFRITQYLAAQDLCLLSENPVDIRRRQYYALSNPGAHPKNWKRLVKVTMSLMDNFSDELKLTIDTISKNRSNNNGNIHGNQPFHQFFEGKRMMREFNTLNGIRSLTTTELVAPIQDEKQKINYSEKVKQKLMTNQLVYFLFGETEDAKLNFLLTNKSQTIEWIVQGISEIVVHSIDEDSYGVVQQDIRLIVKSLIKLKSTLEKVASVNSVAKDRQFISLRAVVRRSLYKFVMRFSRYFDDLLLDIEDMRALTSYASFKEL